MAYQQCVIAKLKSICTCTHIISKISEIAHRRCRTSEAVARGSCVRLVWNFACKLGWWDARLCSNFRSLGPRTTEQLQWKDRGHKSGEKSPKRAGHVRICRGDCAGPRGVSLGVSSAKGWSLGQVTVTGPNVAPARSIGRSKDRDDKSGEKLSCVLHFGTLSQARAANCRGPLFCDRLSYSRFFNSVRQPLDVAFPQGVYLCCAPKDGREICGLLSRGQKADLLGKKRVPKRGHFFA